MKKLFFILCAILMVNTVSARVHEELKDQAEEYANLLQDGNWMLIPNRAQFPKTITFLDMREDANYFKLINDTLDIRLDFMGTRVQHALSEEQLFWLAEENADLLHLLQTAPPFFKAKGTAVNKNVRISKNFKTVTMNVMCKRLEKNFEDYNFVTSFTVRIDVKSGIAEVTCSGMNYNETYIGNIFQVKEM